MEKSLAFTLEFCLTLRSKKIRDTSSQIRADVRYVNGKVQAEYLDRFYEEINVDKINEILYICLIEYNFYRPLRNLNLLTLLEYCSKLLNNEDTSMLQMYRNQKIIG
jgi:hypothetical protein